LLRAPVIVIRITREFAGVVVCIREAVTALARAFPALLALQVVDEGAS
jgi:hypothetical protein